MRRARCVAERCDGLRASGPCSEATIACLHAFVQPGHSTSHTNMRHAYKYNVQLLYGPNRNVLRARQLRPLRLHKDWKAACEHPQTGEKDEKGRRRNAETQGGGGRGHSQLTAASTLGSAHTAVLARGMELPGCCWSLGSLCGLPDPRGEYEYANAAEVCACSAFVYFRTLLHAACSQPPLRSDTLRLDFPVSVFKCSGPANHRRPARARLGKCV